MDLLLKRAFDITASLTGLIILSPILAVVAVAVRLESPGGSLFLQERVGRHGHPFNIIKFRTMRPAIPGDTALITVGADPRITRLGQILRASKIDELPQLLNVLRGDMSLVGPRPEVPAYVARYTSQQRKVIHSVRPGITDFAAIEFSDEASILARADDPEAAYINEVMPRKFALYQRYVNERNFWLDLKLILKTLKKLLPR